MENFKISLSDLYLTEEQQISEDGYDQRGGYEYKLKVGDRRYILTYDVNKNPTKKGIKVKFFTLDDKGNEIEIGFKTYRSKQGSDGKTSNTMQYSPAMQKCFKTGKKQ